MKTWGKKFFALFFFVVVVGGVFLLSSVEDDVVFEGDDVVEVDEYTMKRFDMVESQLRQRNIVDERVLKALETVPRHLFMPHSKHLAYEDHPVPIGYSQTISQPYIVALMIQELELSGDEVVLEVGAGSGYNAAVLSEIVKEVHTFEIIAELAVWADEALKGAGYDNVQVVHGDGYYGVEGMEFDAIIITAAANHVPPPLIKQLKMGGKLILPLSTPAGFQALTVITKTPDGVSSKVITGVRFVPMTGKAME